MLRESINSRLHGVLALLAVWLVVTSPWVSMLRRIPESAGVFDYAHVALGWLALALAFVYSVSVMGRGRWKQYLPSRAAGLTGVIEGLLLIALLLTALTGAAWLLAQGSAHAIAWRGWHILSARVLLAVGIAHLLAVASHLLDFLRD